MNFKSQYRFGYNCVTIRIYCCYKNYLNQYIVFSGRKLSHGLPKIRTFCRRKIAS